MSRYIVKLCKAGPSRRLGIPAHMIKSYGLLNQEYVSVEDNFPDMIVIRKLPGMLDAIKKRGVQDNAD